MGLTALCPGTFDPVTNGHLDIIERASQTFETVVVAVLENPAKLPMFSIDERVAMLEKACAGMTGVEVEAFKGLLVDFARSRGDAVIVKGLRAVSDYEFEIQMAQMNLRLGEVETLFMSTNPRWSFLSSSLVKEVARFGGDVEGLVPDGVGGGARAAHGAAGVGTDGPRRPAATARGPRARREIDAAVLLRPAEPRGGAGAPCRDA